MSALTVPSQLAPASPARRLLAQHPLLAYFGIAFGGTWTLLLVPVLAQNGLGLLPFLVPDVAMLLLFIAATLAGPTLGAIVITAATGGKPGLRHFFRRYVQVQVGLRWYLLALFGLPLIVLLAASASFGVAPLQAALAQWPLFFTAYLPAVLIFMIFPALTEEPGWRGFALPRLQQQYGPLLGSLILGLLHGVWHLPAFLMTAGPMAMGPFNAGAFVYNTLVIMVTAVIWTWVFNNARGSIFMALVLHGTNNAVGVLANGWGPMFSTAAVGTMGDMLLVVCALLIIVFTRGRLSYRPGVGLPPAEMPQPEDLPLPQA
jgi:membrane protease YdiL (CAAX protease family)